MRLAIISALRWECRPVLKALPRVSRQSVGGWPAWTARAGDVEVWLVQSGVGLARAGDAAAAIVASGRFDLLLSAGCAGALAPELRPGDLVVASAGVADGRRFAVDAAFERRAQQICRERSLPWHAGSILTSPVVLTKAAVKREAAQSSGAIAVEMEAGAIAAVAAQHEIPFGQVRAILDTAELELHESGDFMDPETGRVRPFDVLRFVASRPSAAPQLFALRRMMAAAESSLQKFFAGYLRSIAG